MRNKTAIAALALSTAAFIGGNAQATNNYAPRIARLERQVATLQQGVRDAKAQAQTARLLADKINCIKYVLPVIGTQASVDSPVYMTYVGKDAPNATWLVAFDPARPGCISK